MSELEELYARTLDEIDSDFEKKRKSVESDIEQAGLSIENLFASNHFSLNAIVDFEKMSLDDTQNYLLPKALRIGNLLFYTMAGSHVPAILPFTDANATAFVIDRAQNNEETIQRIFQLIAFRLMMSLPVNLCRFHFVDTYSLGRKFNIMNRLSEKIKHNAIVSDEKMLNELIVELEQSVMEINRNQLIRYHTIEEYNRENPTLAVAYRFVFLSNFPHGFSKDLADRFFKLIHDQNAIRTGIYVFFSIDNDVATPYGFDISKYMNISTLAHPLGEYRDMYEIDNSIFDKSFYDTFFIQFHTHLPPNLEAVIAAINRKADNVKPAMISLDADIDKMIETQVYWKGDTRLGVKIPVGKRPVDETLFFELGGATTDYFAMVGGRPGYGKTVLLHNIIRNGAIIYSPEELQFYLIDCKDGVGFQIYKNLPHAKFISTNNNLDLILDALQMLQNEMKNRARLFKEASEKYNTHIVQIEDYRETCNITLPRIILVIDEFQLLLSGGYRQANIARETLTDLIKRGRSAGINIVFCTQSYRNVDFDTNLITLRMAFSLESYDSEKILRNDTASQLRLRGEAILNRTGDKKDNVKFQCAYIDEKNALVKYVKFCQDKISELPGFQQKIYRDDIGAGNLMDNRYFAQLLSDDKNRAFKENSVYLGAPYYMGDDHICFSLDNRNASNVIFIGNDLQAAMSSILLANLQLMLQNRVNSKFYIIDFLNTDHRYASYFAGFAALSDNITSIPKGDLSRVTDEIEQELNRRIENDTNRISNADEGKIVLTLSYIQVARELKKVGWDDSPVTKKLMKILKDGSEFGIHLMFYSYSQEGLFDDMFDNKIFDYFENRILLQGGKILRHEEYNIQQGCGLIDNKAYKLTPFVFYNTFEGHDNPGVQAILDYIFSIYN